MGCVASKRILQVVVGPNSKTPFSLASLIARDKELCAFLREAFQGIDPSLLLDTHCHLLGLGCEGSKSMRNAGVSLTVNPEPGSGCFIHPKAYSPYSAPVTHVKIKAMMVASGILSRNDPVDIGYARVLGELVEGANAAIQLAGGQDQTRSSTHHGMRCIVLPFDQVYSPKGEPDLTKTTMHIPNDWAYRVALENPKHFVPSCSVHPYRKDALAELERCASRGQMLVKWLPNSMRIDPSHELCRPFYTRMRELGMVLLSHTGAEHSVDAAGTDQSLGNPLLLRAALDAGVIVIAAHCASDGYSHDLDKGKPHKSSEHSILDILTPMAIPIGIWALCIFFWSLPAFLLATLATLLFGVYLMYNILVKSIVGTSKGTRVENFELLMRMMEEPAYSSLLYADISAMMITKRTSYLNALLDRTHLHPRLVYGSDYPLPCVRAITSTAFLAYNKLITKRQARFLNIIYEHNPLLYDICCKLVIRSAKGSHFSHSIFQAPLWMQTAVLSHFPPHAGKS